MLRLSRRGRGATTQLRRRLSTGRRASRRATPRDWSSGTLAAAQAALAAGSPGRAAALVAEARTRPLNERDHAEVARLRAAVSFTLGEGPESSELLLQAARELEPIDAALARAAYLGAGGGDLRGSRGRRRRRFARARPLAPRLRRGSRRRSRSLFSPL